MLDKASGVFTCYSLRRISMVDRSDPQLLAMHPATPAPPGNDADSDSYRLEVVPIPWGDSSCGRESKTDTDDDGGGGFSSFAHLSLSLKDWIHGESIFASPTTTCISGLDPMRTCLSLTLLLHRSTPAVTVLVGRRVLHTTIPLLWLDDFDEFREASDGVHPLHCSPTLLLQVVSINCCRGRSCCFGLVDKVMLHYNTTFLPFLLPSFSMGYPI